MSAVALNSRAVAAQVMGELLQNRGSLSQLLPRYGATLDERNRALVAEFCYGASRHFPKLTGLVDQLLSRPLKPRDSDIQALLLIGCYQLLYMRVPDHAAIAETVAAAALLNKAWAKGLINGVLRNCQRQHRSLEDRLDEAAANSHPRWLLDEISRQWPAHRDSIVAANNQAPPMTLRVNRRRGPRGRYLQNLQAAGLSARPCRHSPDGIQLDTACDVSRLPDFHRGACSVQDEASQLAAPLLRLRDGDRVLDCCCAPGGKTGHLLELAKIELDAVELDPERLQRVTDNLQRLGLSAKLICADASRPQAWWSGRPYSAILLDAPCSATGVIRRHPDIKLLRRPSDLGAIVELQRKLLDKLWPVLAPGGVLVYSTCSILQQENEQLIRAFCDATPDCKSDAIDADWGEPRAFGRQILPTPDGPDGFFYASLTKHL